MYAMSGRSQSQRIHSVSISMPSSPTEVQLQSTNRFIFRDHDGTVLNNDSANSSSASTNLGPIQAKFCSHPILAGSSFDEAVASGLFPNCPELPPKNPRTERLKDKRFDSFKTWSGKLERQLSHLCGKSRETGSEANPAWNVDVEMLPVDRYFDALEGPELDTLRASEEILLPEEKQWPFLLRFPISSFGICLGVSSQAIMWKRLATSASTKFLHINLNVNLILWYIAVALVAIISVIYLLKVIFYFEAVRREYFHPIRINFFFAPLITLLFLALGVPPSVAQNLHAALWYILMTPIFCLELKILWTVDVRRTEEAFKVGLAHYTVLFVTLYQRLPTNVTLPKELHPVFFLFVAAPSVASMSWAGIQDSFDYGSRIAYFIALFLYFSLAVRVNFFRGFRFSLSWWAYTFPMTAAAIATIKYCNEVPSIVTKSLSVILSAIATLVVISLLVTSILHAFVLRDLFPNDIAIAISEKRPKTTRKWFPRRTSSPGKDIENYLKFVDSVSKDIEACPTPSSSITKAVDKFGTI
ncbi:SLAC1 homologue 3 [Actinidia rufa]|uniref:SLAC1 homologue 3 n=1 Tax=Actinidia rufa TaxID=165716 RepID=A0A7J0G6J7_9ERIC|nr:SLAC1 homologue 3 [Actinidia rufa]